MKRQYIFGKYLHDPTPGSKFRINFYIRIFFFLIRLKISLGLRLRVMILIDGFKSLGNNVLSDSHISVFYEKECKISLYEKKIIFSANFATFYK